MEDPLLSAMHHETDLEVAQRAYDFMLWIRNRTEKELLGSLERKDTVGDDTKIPKKERLEAKYHPY